jgi:hypothetical protein
MDSGEEGATMKGIEGVLGVLGVDDAASRVSSGRHPSEDARSVSSSEAQLLGEKLGGQWLEAIRLEDLAETNFRNMGTTTEGTDGRGKTSSGSGELVSRRDLVESGSSGQRREEIEARGTVTISDNGSQASNFMDESRTTERREVAADVEEQRVTPPKEARGRVKGGGFAKDGAFAGRGINGELWASGRSEVVGRGRGEQGHEELEGVSGPGSDTIRERSLGGSSSTTLMHEANRGSNLGTSVSGDNRHIGGWSLTGALGRRVASGGGNDGTIKNDGDVRIDGGEIGAPKDDQGREAEQVQRGLQEEGGVSVEEKPVNSELEVRGEQLSGADPGGD